MAEFGTLDTAIIVGMIVCYILFTSGLRAPAQPHVGAVHDRVARAAGLGRRHAADVRVRGRQVYGAAPRRRPSLPGFAAAWSVIGASIGFLLFGLFFVRKLYGSGEYTISSAIAQKYGRTTMLTVSLIMIYALLIVNVGNYISGAAAIATVLKLNLPAAMCIIAASAPCTTCSVA